MHSACCTLHKNVKSCLFLGFVAEVERALDFGPAHLSAVCFSDPSPSAKFIDTHPDRSATATDLSLRGSKRLLGGKLHITGHWPSVKPPIRQAKSSFKGPKRFLLLANNPDFRQIISKTGKH